MPSEILLDWYDKEAMSLTRSESPPGNSTPSLLTKTLGIESVWPHCEKVGMVEMIWLTKWEQVGLYDINMAGPMVVPWYEWITPMVCFVSTMPVAAVMNRKKVFWKNCIPVPIMRVCALLPLNWFAIMLSLHVLRIHFPYLSIRLLIILNEPV